ncbi:permease for cytosine/purines, uracil, thiamine, allantoin-domain-containing protein [Aspergillus undulatus]|uniref:permease for cytosine/purines, uracil, thiamine, allantoin-domain-containing protein n=1 Tax=Aspergillus undulatus TaxID=1810928 RepID=UPI003CCCC674
MDLLRRAHDKIIVKSVDADRHLRLVSSLDNDSIRPTRLQDRTWTQLTYISFWFFATANVSNLDAASTGLTVGLSMWGAVACSFARWFLAGILMALNGRAGALYHIPFPVQCRASFGVWGALWPTFNRAAMSVVWNGVLAVQGAQCIYVFLHTIFPSMENIHDKMGPSSALNSAGMICFFVYWVINSAFLFVPVPKMKPLVYIKVFVYYAALIAMTVWTVTLAGGKGSALRMGSRIHGFEKSWMVCRFLFIGLVRKETIRRPLGPIVQLFVPALLVADFGNVIASASESVFEESVWNPLDFLDMLMAGERYTSENRTAFLSYAINPWYLLSSASVSTDFLSSYQIFLSGITGILICDYYLLRRGRLNISDLYSASTSGSYYYFYGFGIHVFVAYIAAIVPNFYGFLNSMGVDASIGVQRFYYVAYMVGLLVAFGLYYALVRIWRVEDVILRVPGAPQLPHSQARLSLVLLYFQSEEIASVWALLGQISRMLVLFPEISRPGRVRNIFNGCVLFGNVASAKLNRTPTLSADEQLVYGLIDDHDVEE